MSDITVTVSVRMRAGEESEDFTVTLPCMGVYCKVRDGIHVKVDSSREADRVKTLEDALGAIIEDKGCPTPTWIAKQALAAKEPSIEHHTKTPHLGNGALTCGLWWCECGRGLGENINLFDIHKRFRYCPRCGVELDWQSVGLGDITEKEPK